MSSSALSASFDYLCYGSAATIFSNSFSAGIDLMRQNLTSNDGPRAEKVQE